MNILKVFLFLEFDSISMWCLIVFFGNFLVLNIVIVRGGMVWDIG